MAAQRVNLNMVPNNSLPQIHLSQGDIGRQFVLNLVDSSTGYEIPAGATVTVRGTKPSGMGYTVTGTVNESAVTVVTTADMTDEFGMVASEVVITSGGTVIGSTNFVLAVEKDPHPAGTIDGRQESLIPELTLLVERVEAAAASVHDLSVSATTLAPGSAATATYDDETNQISFGIPRGADGVDGEVTQEQLDAAVDDLKSEISNHVNLADIGGYVNGTYTNSGILTSGNTTRVRYNRFVLLHAGDRIYADVPPDTQITISRFNSETKALIKEGWEDTNPYTAEGDVLVLPVWKKRSNETITPTEIGTVYVCRSIASFANSVNESTSAESVYSEYVNGSFLNTGKLTFRDDRIRFSKRVFLRAGDAIKFTEYEGQWHGYSTWVKDDTAEYGFTLIKDYTLNGVTYAAETISFDTDCYVMATYGESGTTDFKIEDLKIVTTITSRLTYEHDYNYISKVAEPRKTYDFGALSMGGNIVAHRGEPYAENTMLAFKKCVANGTKVLEIDLAFTSDNVPVLLHDTTINRTGRNADGTQISQTINIADITYQQALQYDFGIWKGTEYAGQKIPTLKDALLYFKRKNCCAIVDLTGHAYTSTQYAIMHDVFISIGMVNHVTLNASTSQLDLYTAKYQDTPINPSGSTNNIRMVRNLATNYRDSSPLIIVSGFANLAEDLSYDFFSEIHKLGVVAIIGFANTSEEITTLFDVGCDMVYSDTITPNNYTD